MPHGITKREDSILRKYSKSIGMPYKFNLRLYLRGDQKQRQIDLIAQEATLWLKEKREKGLLKPNKKGKISIKLTDKLIQEFIKERYGSIDKMPEFFRKPLPVMEENKLFSKSKKKSKDPDVVIEESSPEYLNDPLPDNLQGENRMMNESDLKKKK